MSIKNLGLCLFFVAAVALSPCYAADRVAGNMILLNDNGGWCWYQDDKVIYDPFNGNILTSTAADDTGFGGVGGGRTNDVDVTIFNIDTGKRTRSLQAEYGGDDHNMGAFWIRPDGRYLHVYGRHNTNDLTYYRTSTNPHDGSSWAGELNYDWSTISGISGGTLTYTNLHYLSAEGTGNGRLYNIVRWNGSRPNISYSDDLGVTWEYAGLLSEAVGPAGYSYYYHKFRGNGADRIDFICTEQHPRNYNNNVYHGYIKDGKSYDSYDNVIDDDIFDQDAPGTDEFTRIFTADPAQLLWHTGWTNELEMDENGYPVCLYQTRYGQTPWGNGSGQNNIGAADHRFFYARFNGTTWTSTELCKLGVGLHEPEQDYTGMGCIHPNDVNIVYVATQFDPRDDTEYEYREIFKGVTYDNGLNWDWTQITFDSTQNNTRPAIPPWDAYNTAVVWTRGNWQQTSYENYDLVVVGIVEEEEATLGLVSYIDADELNTTESDGSPFEPTGPSGSAGSADDQWHEYTGYGNGGSCYTAGETGDENAPTLKTTISGLSDGIYDVFAYFWCDPDADWGVRGGFDSSDMLCFNKQSSQHAEASQFSGSVDVVNGDYILYRVYIGREEVSGGGSIDVYLDNYDGSYSGDVPTRTTYDGVGVAGVSFVEDLFPPEPNEMTWDSEPAATGPSTITMTATAATDDSPPVQYYFECTTDGDANSGWQTNPTYVATGLTPSTLYSFKVKARDSSAAQNETDWSSTESATTEPPDTTPPEPDPMTWDSFPTATGAYTITMTASTATDATSPPVEYYFECTNDGTKTSGWQSSSTYVASGLTPNTQYTFKVKARDSAVAQNETGWSSTESATTPLQPTTVVYDFNGITSPSGTHTAEDGEIDVADSMIENGTFPARRGTGINGWANWGEATTAEYANLVGSDDNHYQGAGAGWGDNAAMIFEFYVSESPEDLEQIDVSVELGRGSSTDLGWVYIWDYNTSSYLVLGSQSGTEDQVVSASVSVNPGDYVEPGTGQLTVFVVNEDDGWQNDWIRVDDISVTLHIAAAPPQRALTTFSTVGGSVTTPGEPGPYYYDHGTDANIVATADPNYQFVNWTGTGVDAGKVADPNAATTTITMDANYTIRANFEPVGPVQRTLTISSTTGGDVNVPGEGVFGYDDGTVVDLEAIADLCHYFVNWTGDTGTIADVNAAVTTITMNGDYTIQAHFETIQFTITASAGTGGSIAPSGAVVVDCGDDQLFTATANLGYKVDTWYLDGNDLGISDVNYTLTNITSDHTVHVTFKQQFTITATSGANGSVDPNGAIVKSYGDDQSFTATPDVNYAVDTWYLDGNSVQVGGGTYTLYNITADHTVHVTFAQQQFTVTASADANGSIDPNGAIPVIAGADQLFTAKANPGYEVDTWYLDGNDLGISDVNYTLTNITSDHTVHVTFVQLQLPSDNFDDNRRSSTWRISADNFESTNVVEDANRLNLISIGEDMAASCVGHWKMNDNEPNNKVVLDSSGNGNHGTFNDATGDPNTQAHHVDSGNPPNLNGALTFDGTDDYVDVGSAIGTGAYTKVAWIMRADAANRNNIISSDTASHVFWAPDIYSFKLSAGHNGDWDGVQDTTEPLAADTWYFVAVTFDPNGETGEMVLYKNGDVVDSDTVQTQSSSMKTYIGRFLNNYNFNGAIDNVMIFDRALSQEEISSLYNNGDGTEIMPISGGYGSAYYVANGWNFDVTKDFEVKVDFHYSDTSSSYGWDEMALEKDRDNYVLLSAGFDGNEAYFYYEEAVDGNVVDSGPLSRDSNDGTLYISYDANSDKLYLSTTGYGSGDVQIIGGLLAEQWSYEPVSIAIGGGSSGAALGTGEAYLDNFEVTTATLLGWPPATDIDGNGFIEWDDLMIMCDSWLDTGPDIPSDIYYDEIVNLLDFAEFGLAW